VFGPASRVFYDTLLTHLDRGQDAMLGLGLVLVVAGLFAGESTAVRATVAPGIENVGARARQGQVGAARGWAANRRWPHVCVVLVGVVVPGDAGRRPGCHAHPDRRRPTVDASASEQE
jgi:hypothetical protein